MNVSTFNKANRYRRRIAAANLDLTPPPDPTSTAATTTDPANQTTAIV